MMRIGRAVYVALLCGVLGSALAPAQQSSRMYNMAKVKLMKGQPIFGGTVQIPDPNLYCAVANSGWDFTWIEMQHNAMSYSDAAKLIWACKGSTAAPFIRVPDATESDIQKATDMGALGIIVPTVETVEKAQAAVKWAKYPPLGRRSQGQGQHSTLYGSDYRQTANDNIMVVVMIETPEGAAIADKIAAVPGIDVVFAASTDLGNFSGFKQGEPKYEALVTRIHDATLKAGRKLGGPIAWRDRPGFTFFQARAEIEYLMNQVQTVLKGVQR